MKARPPELYGININEIARICSVSLKTATRWKDGQTVPPKTALMILRIKAHGDLSELGPEWEGWTYRGGTFTSPDGWNVTRNDALSVPLLDSYVQSLRSKLADLEATRDGLEEQPAPGDIPSILTG